MIRKILITGGAGYLGSHLALQLLKDDQNHLFIYSRDELKHFDLKLKVSEHADRMTFIIGDVRDQERLYTAMEGVDVVIHAAAMKQVGTCEENPTECYKTNVEGTANVVRAARKAEAQKLIFISSDKAVEPLSVYGNSKQAGEKLVLRANDQKLHSSVVRLGNLMGSPGSIIDKLQKQQLNVITLYDEALTRFVDSLENAHQLVATQMAGDFGGTIMLPKLKSVYVKDLVSTHFPTVQISYGQSRGYEKIHEKLATGHELDRALQTNDYYLICEHQLSEDEALDSYQALPAGLTNYDSGDVRWCVPYYGNIRNGS